MKLSRFHWAIMATLTGCTLPATHAGSAPTAEQSTLGYHDAAFMNHPLSGTVDFGLAVARKVQATMGNIAIAATVSLIDTSTNTTVATTLTNASGSFLLNFPPSFTPPNGSTYLLEAVKGLNNNLPANNAARVRTIVEYQSGWQSITNNAVGGPVGIGASTTALAVGAQLRNLASSPSVSVPYPSLIGQVTVSGGSASYSGTVANLSTTDYTSILNIVSNALTTNSDPVAGIQLQNTTWAPIGGAMTAISLSPATGPAGTMVSISGSNFPTTGTFMASFAGGATASATSMNSLSATVSVPIGAISGPVILTANGVSVTAGLFTVPVSVASLSATTSAPGSILSITGSGFSAYPGLDQVVFNAGATASVIAASPTSLSVVVPQATATGSAGIFVNVAGATASSAPSTLFTLNSMVGTILQ